MQVARIVFAGVFCFGVGCVLPEEGDVTTDQRVDPTNLDDSIDHQSEALAYEDEAMEYALDEAISGEMLESTIEIESEAVLDDEADPLGRRGKKKEWVCEYCYYDRDDDDDGRHVLGGRGGRHKECYKGYDKDKWDAKDEAKDKCHDKHKKGCKFDGCKKKKKGGDDDDR